MIAPAPAERAAAPLRRRPESSKDRLLRAFRAIESFPALASSRNALLDELRQPSPATAPVVSVIEAEPALAMAVLVAANRPAKTPIESIAEAVASMSRAALGEIALRVPSYDFLDDTSAWASTAERFRLHALATKRAAEKIWQKTGAGNRDHVGVAALLHDIGKLALTHGYDRYPEIAALRATPTQALELERRQLGVDHAVAGGVLARRLGLPPQLAAAIERHHSDDASGDAAVVRLADMLVHHFAGDPTDRVALRAAAVAVGLDDAGLRELIAAGPGGDDCVAISQLDPSPLSRRQTEVLRRLGEGKLYKQIAAELHLSESTVRQHIHRLYDKLGVADRAQAVLLATSRGWL